MAARPRTVCRGVLVAVVVSGGTVAYGQRTASGIPSPIVQAAVDYQRQPAAASARALFKRPDYTALMRGYRRAVDDWIAAAPAPERDQRFRASVGLALELAALGVDGTLAQYQAASPLIEWACARFRKNPTSEFERASMVSAIAILQGSGDRAIAGSYDTFTRVPGHLTHALTRFPDDPRVRLAVVLSRHETQIITTRKLGPAAVLPQHWMYQAPQRALDRLNDTFNLLTALETSPVREEVLLRRGVLRMLVGKTAEASQDLSQLSTSSTPFISYLANVMLGSLYYRTGETDAAVARYSRAMAAMPATAARLGLATALLRRGNAEQAAAVMTTPAADATLDDPWRLYSLGLFHSLPDYLAEMRTFVR